MELEHSFTACAHDMNMRGSVIVRIDHHAQAKNCQYRRHFYTILSSLGFFNESLALCQLLHAVFRFELRGFACLEQPQHGGVGEAVDDLGGGFGHRRHNFYFKNKVL